MQRFDDDDVAVLYSFFARLDDETIDKIIKILNMEDPPDDLEEVS